MLTTRDNPAATNQRPGTGRRPGLVAMTGRFGATYLAPNRLSHPGLGNPLVLADTRGLIRLAEGVHPVAAHRVHPFGEVHTPRGVIPRSPP